ncbi:hypothetical protein MVEN_00184400 [Mycena venus]|uniref:Uncharacterized protein n=1 Tax=Mycena venus TaxID=2733690 RepID=A0A8H7DBR4_9AGAR|nr:hypothetical protein MVEN_00184400 [Mycena venus]
MSSVNDVNIPDGFILVNGHPSELWSKAAFDHVERLQKDEESRDPDAHGLYIYNDYFGYACCDLLKKEMLAIGKLVASKTEKTFLNTFHRLEGLTLFMANSMAASVFHTIDDPDLAEAIYNAYGALWMTYILDLEAAAKPQKLGPTHPVAIRNLENVVRTAAKGITEFSGLGFDKDADDLESAILRVLERNDMDGSAKEKLFLGKSANSDDEGEQDEEEEAPPSKKSRRTGADDADVRATAPRPGRRARR